MSYKSTCNKDTERDMSSTRSSSTEALRRAIAHPAVGSQSNLAALLSQETGRPIKQGHVSHWLKAGLPPAYCPSVEKLTGGAVRCEELAPEVDWAFLRSTS